MDTISTYKSRIDGLMNILFGAGVSNPQTIIEQLNYLLFMRALSVKDDEAELLGIADESGKIFTGNLSKYKWSNLLALNAEDLFKTLEDAFDAIQKKSENATVKLLFRNAHVKIFDKPTLRRVLHEIEEFAKELDTIAHDGNKDVFGDMYEYLLSKLASAGTNGQFRTPRHIIDFMVHVLDPKKNETILDPACGTAGFLVATYRYIAGEYTSEKMKKAGSPRAMDKLSSEEKNFLYNHMFTGFDSDEDMIKFGMMNLHLHGLTKSRLARQNTLTDTTGYKEKFDVILANPPFSGKLDEESVSEDIRMGTKATELLFLRFMMEHLSSNGKMAVVVPEGVVFGDTKAHVKVRELLLDNGLWCIVSLPAGVFNPYSGTVTTSILFLDKASKKVSELLFCRVESDGYDLGSQRAQISENDLPVFIEEITLFHGNSIVNTKKYSPNHDRISIVRKSEILKHPLKSLSLSAYVSESTSQKSDTPTIALREILTPVLKTEVINSANIYKQITVKIWGKGVELRKELSGSQIKTKRQFLAESGQFIISKIDARNGAFGIVPAELDGAVVTQDFPLFSINKKLITENFLKRITQSKHFYDICLKSSLGTSNRKRLKVELFLSKKIPFISLDKQKEIDLLDEKINSLQEKIGELEENISLNIEDLWTGKSS